jgi:hypothetical protein
MKTDSLIVTAIALGAAAVVWWEREAMFRAQALEVAAQAQAVKIEHKLHVSLWQAWALVERHGDPAHEDVAGRQAAGAAHQGTHAGFRAQTQWWRERVREALGSEQALLQHADSALEHRNPGW